MARKLKKHKKNSFVNLKEREKINNEDFEKAEKILKAMLKVPPPKK